MYTESTKSDERSVRGEGVDVSIVIQGEWARHQTRLAGLDKHRWDNGRLKQLVALETPNGRSLDLATLPYAIAACRKAYGSVFSSDRRGFDGS